MDTLLITEAEVKSLTPLQRNVTTDKVEPSIRVAQRRYIREALGAALYDALVAAVAAAAVEGADPLAAEWEALLEQVRPALAYWALVEALPGMLVQLTNTGPQLQHGRESTNADYKAVEQLLTTMRERATWYTGELRVFVTENLATYPAFAPAATPLPRQPLGGLHFDGVTNLPVGFLSGPSCA